MYISHKIENSKVPVFEINELHLVIDFPIMSLRFSITAISRLQLHTLGEVHTVIAITGQNLSKAESQTPRMTFFQTVALRSVQNAQKPIVNVLEHEQK